MPACFSGLKIGSELVNLSSLTTPIGQVDAHGNFLPGQHAKQLEMVAGWVTQTSPQRDLSRQLKIPRLAI